MEMTPAIKNRIENIMQLIDQYSTNASNPKFADYWERKLFNAASELNTAVEEQQAEAERKAAQDEREGNIRTPQQLEEKFKSMYRRQLADPADKSNWRMILDWARDYEHDDIVADCRKEFYEAHRDDKEEKMQELFEYLLYNTDNETYGMNKTTVVRFHMYGGGPAGGIDFTFGDDGDLEKAEAWHTEWFSEAVKYRIPDDDAEKLAQIYNAREHATGEW